jgi:hypothetical protein
VLNGLSALAFAEPLFAAFAPVLVAFVAVSGALQPEK